MDVQNGADGPLTAAFVSYVRDVMKRRSINYPTIADKAGIAESTLANLLRYYDGNGGKRTRSSTASRIAAAVKELDLETDDKKIDDPVAASPPKVGTIEGALSTLRAHGITVILIAEAFNSDNAPPLARSDE